MKLLIVDDSMIVRNAIQRGAAQERISAIFQAQDGREALELFRQHRPQLVTMDLTMPHVDGLACLQELQAVQADASILVISALNSHATAMKAIALGACGFLVKPFTAAELAEALQDLVAHAAGILE